VVIPKQIRESLGWEQGEDLQVEIVGQKVVITPKESGPGHRPWMRWRGVLAGTDALEDLEREHREEVEREDAELAEYLRREGLSS
jgi:AbrB family looped-hinge helix DNA binding protein